MTIHTTKRTSGPSLTLSRWISSRVHHLLFKFLVEPRESRRRCFRRLLQTMAAWMECQWASRTASTLIRPQMHFVNRRPLNRCQKSPGSNKSSHTCPNLVKATSARCLSTRTTPTSLNMPSRWPTHASGAQASRLTTYKRCRLFQP